MFRRVDEHCYSYLQKELLQDYYKDKNEYPKTLKREYYMINNNTPFITTTLHRITNGRIKVNVMFTQIQTSRDQGNTQGRKQVPGIHGRITDHLCFKCNEYIHSTWHQTYENDTNNSNNKTEQQGCTAVGCVKIVFTERSNGEDLI